MLQVSGNRSEPTTRDADQPHKLCPSVRNTGQQYHPGTIPPEAGCNAAENAITSYICARSFHNVMVLPSLRVGTI